MTDRPELVIDVDGHVIESTRPTSGSTPNTGTGVRSTPRPSRATSSDSIDGKVWGPQAEGGFVGVNGNLFPPLGKAVHFDALFVGEKGRDGQPYPGTVATLLARKDVPDNSLKFYDLDRSGLGRIGEPTTRPEPEEARRAVVPGTVSARL